MILKTNYASLFNDKRLDKRGDQLLSSLFKTGSRSIQSISASRAEQKGYYRLLKNEKVTEDILINEIVNRCGKVCKDKVVLSIQDSSEINLSNHRNRIMYDESIGSLNNNDSDAIGFKVHPSFVIDAYSCYPYGYSAIDIWSTNHERKELSEYEHRRLDVSQKGTHVWLQSSKTTHDTLREAKSVIIVQDREGDFYEQFTKAEQQEKFYLLIRSNHNRLLEGGIKLWEYIDNQPVIGTYTTVVSTQREGKQGQKREAVIEVKAGKIILKRPQKKRVDMLRSSIVLTVIEARETGRDCEDSILWRLYTTWPVDSFEEACQVIEWYNWRWYIEEVFKVLKKECFDIEGSELESGWSVRKLTIMILDTIVKLFQMAIAYSMPEEEAPETAAIFDEEEIKCIEKINQKIQGKTIKLSNPFNKTKLPWAFWTFARLGGWKGYTSQRKPRFATLINGLKKFYDLYQGYSLEKDVGTQ
jgi:hypothetical protein